MVTEQSFWEQLEKRGVALNQVQRDAVMQNQGALLLLASPGSGKTTTLIAKIGYLIAVQGVAARRIKAVTFSRAAAAEMNGRFQALFPKLEAVEFSTIHSLAFRIVRDYFRQHQVAYQLIEGQAELNKGQILRDIFKSLTKETMTEDQMDELTTYISFIKNKLIPREKWSEVDCSVKGAAKILEAYEAFKTAGETLLLDYDDMLLYAYKALDSEVDLLKRYQQCYDYILTDESQDTSLVQHFILEKLVKAHGNLCVVADDDQSIYSWRGAEPDYLLHFREVYPAARLLYMEQNYRSSRNIVIAANRFIQRNAQRYPKQMFTENPYGAPIDIRCLSDYKQQAKYLIEAIRQCDGKDSIAILYRNSSSAIILVNELERSGLSFAMQDEDKRFFSHWVVADILNFMRLSYSDKRIDIFEKIFAKMNGYITKQQLEAVKELGNHESVFQNLLRHVPLQDYQWPLIESCRDVIISLKEKKPLAAIAAIRHQLGYDKALDRMCDRLGFRKEYLLGILNTLEEIASGLDSVEAFANRLKHLETVTKQARQKKDHQVTLSTFHSAKGMEFDKVYMIDLIEGIIPAASDVTEKQQGKPAAMAEAVRLFYVAMTRARHQLQLITYEKRDQEKVSESQFVMAIRHMVTPPKAPSPQALQPQRQPVRSPFANTRPVPIQPEKVLSPTAIRKREGLQVGARVRHARFGEGQITALNAVSLDIQFADKVKTLAVAVCLEEGFLEPIG